MQILRSKKINNKKGENSTNIKQKENAKKCNPDIRVFLAPVSNKFVY